MVAAKKSSQKNAFWEALLVTILIFGIGIIFGITLENWRTGKVDTLYQKSEIELLDVRIQSEIYSEGLFDCKNIEEEIVKFADKVYEEARLLTQYEQASKLTDTLVLQHERYDLLRASLWLNSIKAKEKCNSSLINVVYFYQYNEPDFDVKAKQGVFSKILGELKEKHGNEIILIPIAADLDLTSINILKLQYNVTHLPTIIINGGIKITEVEKVEDIEKLL